MKNKWQYVWLFVFVIICLLSFGGSIIAENKKGPYRSSDEFLSDTVSSRAFHIDIAVVDNSKVYNHQIDVDQVSDIHTIKSTGNSTYVANYRTGDLQIGDMIFHIPMAKATDIFNLLEEAKEVTQVSDTEKDYIISQEAINNYLLETSANLINDGSYTYPLAEQDVKVQVYKDGKYLTRIFYQLQNSLSIEYQFSNYNDIEREKEIPPVDLPNPNILEETIDFSTWNFFRQV